MVNNVWSFMSDSKRQHMKERERERERERLLSRLMKAGAEERGGLLKLLLFYVLFCKNNCREFSFMFHALSFKRD
jgi:hypothetical protein